MEPEALSVPLDHGDRLYQHHDVQAPRPDPIKPDPEQAIELGEPWAAGTLATQDCQLVAERNDLELQFRAAAKPISEP